MIFGLVLGVVLGVIVGFIIANVCDALGGKWARTMRVEVGQSEDYGRPLQHMMSARIIKRNGKVLHFERVDMREEGWEERLAEATASMKQKRNHLLAASKIAKE